ncbi:MAG: hypothetical protein WBM80_15945, partial [Woeseiaceae bacterium]
CSTNRPKPVGEAAPQAQLNPTLSAKIQKAPLRLPRPPRLNIKSNFGALDRYWRAKFRVRKENKRREDT